VAWVDKFLPASRELSALSAADKPYLSVIDRARAGHVTTASHACPAGYYPDRLVGLFGQHQYCGRWRFLEEMYFPALTVNDSAETWCDFVLDERSPLDAIFYKLID